MKRRLVAECAPVAPTHCPVQGVRGADRKGPENTRQPWQHQGVGANAGDEKHRGHRCRNRQRRHQRQCAARRGLRIGSATLDRAAGGSAPSTRLACGRSVWIPMSCRCRFAESNGIGGPTHGGCVAGNRPQAGAWMSGCPTPAAGFDERAGKHCSPAIAARQPCRLATLCVVGSRCRCGVSRSARRTPCTCAPGDCPVPWP